MQCAVQTSLTNGAVLKGAKSFVKLSHSPAQLAEYVDASKTESHLDPLTAAPSKNQYLETVVPWLKKVLKASR